MIAVFAALDAEVRASIGWTSETTQREIAGFPVVEGPGFIVCQTGMGRRAEVAAEAILAQVNVSVVASVGIAGGLSPKLEIGEVVFCEQIDHESHRDPPREETVYSDYRLMEAGLAAAKGIGLKAATGSSITVDTVAATSMEKSAHHAWKNHDIVEMESYWIGKAAEDAGVPFVAIRTISDAAEHELVKVNASREDGTLDIARLAEWARENPEHAAAFGRQSEHIRAAMTSLTVICAAFLPPLIDHFRSEAA
jgi:adenosylhomocysteine nucleosidase